MERCLQDHIATTAGFSTSDAKEILFIQENGCGVGIRSVTITHLVNIARESKIMSNDMTEAAHVTRSRIDSALGLGQSPLEKIQGNYMAHNMDLLSLFGLHLRDSKFEFINR